MAPVETDSNPPVFRLDQELLRRKIEAHPPGAEQEGRARVRGELLQGNGGLRDGGRRARTAARLIHGLGNEAARLKIAGADRDGRVARIAEDDEPHDAVDERPYSHAFSEAFMRCHSKPAECGEASAGTGSICFAILRCERAGSPQRTPTYASGCRPARPSSGSQLAPVPAPN